MKGNKMTINEVKKIMTTPFGSQEIDVFKPEGSEPGITERQLGEMLGADDPDQYVKRIRQRNSERFCEGTKCTPIELPDSLGRLQKNYVYTFKGVMEVCRFSTLPNANAVMDCSI